MISASELKKGIVVSVNGNANIVISIEVKSPSARGAATLYKVKFKNLITGQNTALSLKGDDKFDLVEFSKCNLQFLYCDNDNVILMDSESYVQYTLNKADLEYELGFMIEGMVNIVGIVSDEKLLSIQLPATVPLKIVQCPPSLKSASASARTKPATLETGIIVLVPEYIDNEETIMVNTETKEYVSKA